MAHVSCEYQQARSVLGFVHKLLRPRLFPCSFVLRGSLAGCSYALLRTFSLESIANTCLE